MGKHEHDFYCPACGEGTDTLYDGYCEPCREDRQARLHAHNFHYDRWQKLSPAQRDAEIKAALRKA